MQKVYSVKEVSQILGVTTRSVYNYIDRDKIKSTKTASGVIRISEEAVNTFLNGGETVSNNQVSINLK